MRERWRRRHVEPSRWSCALYTGWHSVTVGVDVETHQWERTITLRLPFVWLVIEMWRS